MTTEQLTLLAAMVQQSMTKPMMGGSKDGKSEFQDLLEQKREPSTQNKKPAKDNVQEQKPQVEEGAAQQPSESEESVPTEIVAAQQLALAMVAQQYTAAPTVTKEQPAAEIAPIVQTEVVPQQAEVPVETAEQPKVELPEMPAQQPMEEQSDAEFELPKETAKVPVQQTEKPMEAEPEADIQANTKEAPAAAKKPVEKSEKTPEVNVTKTEQPLFRELEATPIKVGENTHVVDTKAPDMDSKIADKIEATLKQVGDKLEIQLTPEHLGKITIELVQNGKGIGLVVHAENAKTNNLLAQHAGGLSALLEDRTGQQVQVQVSQQQNQQPDYDGHNRQQHEGQQQNHAQTEQMDKDEQDSFLGQLRLGLFQMENA